MNPDEGRGRRRGLIESSIAMGAVVKGRRSYRARYLSSRAPSNLWTPVTSAEKLRQQAYLQPAAIRASMRMSARAGRRRRTCNNMQSSSRWRTSAYGARSDDRAAALVVSNRAKRAKPAKGRLREVNRRRPTLPGGCPPSTIGAGGLNFSVRNGKRCTPAAMTAETLAQSGARL